MRHVLRGLCVVVCLQGAGARAQDAAQPGEGVPALPRTEASTADTSPAPPPPPDAPTADAPTTDTPKADPTAPEGTASPAAATRKPAPWVKAPIILGIQVIAGVGARSLVVPLLFVPGVGLLAMLAQPVLEAMAITWAGDRLGDGRAPLVWPLVVSVAVATVANVLLVAGTLLAGGALLTTLVGQVPGITVSPALLIGVLWFGVGLSVVAAAMVMLSNLLGIVSPVASTAIYQALKRRKPAEDNGGERFGLFSPGGPAPAPPPQEKR